VKLPNKSELAQGAKNAVNWTKDTAGKAKDKTRESLNKAYEAKKPFAVEALIRRENPKANPTKIQALLDDELREAEKESGMGSSDFASVVSMYVFTSIEIHNLEDGSPANLQKLTDLMVMLDSSAVRVARKVVGIAATAVMLLPQGKAIKGVKVARKAIAGAAAAAATTKGALKATGKELAISGTIISQTKKILGPAPKSWATELPPEKPAKPAKKAPKK
jgi:hypothetical protein